MKKTFILIFLCVFVNSIKATHNRAGEITYKFVSGFTYEVTITTYTKDSAPAFRCKLDINWGDGTKSTLVRSNGTGGPNPCQADGAAPGELIGNDVRKNVYKGTHTYPAAGAYIVSFEDPNRNAGVVNIPNSINVPFYVESEIVIGGGIGVNSSPTLLNPPIDDGCVNQKFIHNAGAFDSDGDSLAYKLVVCRTSGGQPIPETYDPQYVQDSVIIDPVTGDLIWDVPQSAGQFNFAFEISEWRKDGQGMWVKIGFVIRDLQITIEQCPQLNRPPVLTDPGPFCVEAGQTLDFDITATDPDGDLITLRAFGGPYQVANPADPINAPNPWNPITGNIKWATQCNHVRKQPYFLTVEAKDDPANNPTNPRPNLPRLVDLSTIEIRVVAPAPKNPVANSNENSISLSWDRSICNGADSYKIYRREESYGFVPSECETGVPDYTGYVLLDEVKGLNTTNYEDTIDLVRGVQYCYMVVACFPDESESYASVEFCNSLPLTKPMMTNVDVLSTSADNGNIDVKWIFPPDLDSAAFPPPYSFKLYRAPGISGIGYTEIFSTTDTFYTDAGLNTLDTAYNYKVEMYFGSNTSLLGESDPASSIFLGIAPNDRTNFLRFRSITPWKNYEYVVFRENPTGSGNFEIIDTTTNSIYADTGLVNGQEYCYKVLGIGEFTASDSLPAPLFNNSQEACASPIDTTSPCPPDLTGTFYCERDSLYLEWAYPGDPACPADVVKYNLYYKPTRDDIFETIIATIDVTQGTSISLTEIPVIGCYAISAVDDADQDNNGMANESMLSDIFCADPCPNIIFPNVFTPNNDGSNDFFTAITYRNIGQLNMQIFNRWGTMVYETNNAQEFLEVGWDGRDMNTGEICSNGVYYFVCNYTPQSLDNPIPQKASGFLHLFAEE